MLPLLVRLAVASLCISTTGAFVLTRTTTPAQGTTLTPVTPAAPATKVSPSHPLALSSTQQPSSSSSSVSNQQAYEYTVLDADAATTEWEIDCYSRPVVRGGKKLWEILVTDSAGSFRFRQELPSNQVNSKNVRQVVDNLMEMADTKPEIIRFFRGAMFNMLNIALQELAVTTRPSRCTLALATWLEERHANVYPNMEGYNRNMVGSSAPSFLDVRTPVKLPDALRGEKYAFVSLPVAEFLPGGGVNADTAGLGRLCAMPADIPGDAFVQGVVILSQRAKALASWLAGTEVVALTADLRKRVLIMETDIDTEYLLARLNDQQRAEAAALEEGKDGLKGLHFVCVQEDDDSDPEGFWLLRQLPNNI
eukprot:CAMPEP_0172453568 /NCGR_PEP_ID=MMETSP1065-20121228/10825_1 /TAXON_ID=265537 /ORGANISM="Amphiprora paludosa, Strain CCMP125" /LENGTH=364 /DNA_ID=CAMNT_0013205753 /DNA_START=134 /DNA_END=1228 /DNA_ORIENTATION=-